jgi:hypothetical protein
MTEFPNSQTIFLKKLKFLGNFELPGKSRNSWGKKNLIFTPSHKPCIIPMIFYNLPKSAPDYSLVFMLQILAF